METTSLNHISCRRRRSKRERERDVAGDRAVHARQKAPAILVSRARKIARGRKPRPTRSRRRSRDGESRVEVGFCCRVSARDRAASSDGLQAWLVFVGAFERVAWIGGEKLRQSHTAASLSFTLG